MNKTSRMVPFVVGLLLGVLGMVYLPGQVRPYLADWAMGNEPVARGTVVAKQKKEHTLLLTVNTAAGALSATFTKKVDEIALLVDERDVIEFTLWTDVINSMMHIASAMKGEFEKRYGPLTPPTTGSDNQNASDKMREIEGGGGDVL